MLKLKTAKFLVCLLALLLGPFNGLQAQSANWNWLSYTSSDYDEGAGEVLTDAQGNTFYTGGFTGSIMLNGIPIQSCCGPFSGATYFSRYTPGGSTSDNWTIVLDVGAYNLSLDPAGNLVFLVSVSLSSDAVADTIHFGPNYQYIKPVGVDGAWSNFLVKMDNMGNVLWVKLISSLATSNRIIHRLALEPDAQGNFYLAGGIVSDMAVGTGSGDLLLDSIAVTPTGDGGKFVAKMNANGDFLWAKSFGAKNGNYEGFNLKVNKQNEAFVSGLWYGDTLFFDGFFVLPADAFRGRFITKISPAGNWQWLAQEGVTSGANYDNASLEVKASGNVICLSVIASNSDDSLVLDNGAITLKSPGLVLTQYNAQGNFLGYSHYPGNFSRCNIEGDGEDFFIGATYKDAQLLMGNTNLSNAGGTSGTTDIVLSKIDTTGNVLWAFNLGGDEDDYVGGLEYSPTHGLTVSGATYSSQLQFGAYTLVNSVFYSSDAFTANLTTNGIGLSEFNSIKSINVYPNPTSGVLHFNLEAKQQKNIQVEVRNMLGQTVLQESIDTMYGDGTLNVDYLTPGVYLLNILDGNNVYTGKFIKE
jgi:hypothetical protein